MAAKKAAKRAVKKVAAAVKRAVGETPAKAPATKKAVVAPPSPAPTAPPSAPTPVENPQKKATRRPPGAPPVDKKRVVFPMDLYEPRKDEVKAPFKANGLKWQFLGEGQGRYHKEGVHVFTQFKDDGVHYSLWGDDQATIAAILGEWKRLFGVEALAHAAQAGEAAKQQEQAAAESDALRLWKLQEPQRRPGEPDFFFNKRMEEWKAKRPA